LISGYYDVAVVAVVAVVADFLVDPGKVEIWFGLEWRMTCSLLVVFFR
jgi:hypothetical protein